jgi:hypothetical protein
MSLTTVLSVTVRPDRASIYEAHVHQLAARAVATKERFEWAAYQVVAGPLGTMHFVSEVESWAALAARDPIELLVQRLLGESEGAQLLERVAECVVSERQAIGRDRPDLGHPIAANDPHRANALVTLMRVRPGGEDACEELIRKVAQAIPLVKDPRRFTAYETFIGDSRTYWIVTPLADIGDLDRMLTPRELLQKAFGAEGALVYRTGFDAIERLERQMTMLRPELSNATWLGRVVGLRPRPAAAAHAAH